MVEITRWEADETSDRLYIHFGVDDHFLKLETFVRTADSAKRIIEVLDASFFQGSLDYEFIVLPPEAGTYLTKLGIVLLGAPAAIFTFANTDIGSAYIEALTGRPPTHWATQAGELTRDALNAVTDSKEEAETESCRIGADLVVQMTRGILEKETSQLLSIGMDFGELSAAMDARADCSPSAPMAPI